MAAVHARLNAASVDEERVNGAERESDMVQEKLRREREKQGIGRVGLKARDDEVRSEPANQLDVR